MSLPLQPWNAGLRQDLEELHRNGLLRSFQPLSSPQGIHVQRHGQSLVNFSSNDYLGLAFHPAIRNALAEGALTFGAGSGSARLISGTLEPHAALESRLAEFQQTEACLTFSSGYAAALGILPALLDHRDLVLLDKLSHASLIDGARLSGAPIRVFRRDRLEKLESLLREARGSSPVPRRILVVSESVYSMDGSSAPLPDLVALKDRYQAALLLDEAHAFGILGPSGRGLAAQLGLQSRVDILMGTLGKAAGLAGAFVAGSQALVDTLLNRARSFVFSTAPPPAIAHAALTALDILSSAEGAQLRSQLHSNCGAFASALHLPHPTSAIFPIILGTSQLALEASRNLLEQGYLVPAIRYPTVPRFAARLRVTLAAQHESAMVEEFAGRLAALLKAPPLHAIPGSPQPYPPP